MPPWQPTICIICHNQSQVTTITIIRSTIIMITTTPLLLLLRGWGRGGGGAPRSAWALRSPMYAGHPSGVQPALTDPLCPSRLKG